MEVSFSDYSSRFSYDEEVILKIISEVALSGEFILKSRVSELENIIKDFTGAKHVVAVANGTGAITLGLQAMGVKQGVDVITPAFSFISTASTVANLGGRPVFVDVDPETCMIDPQQIEKSITADTKVIMPAHLFSVMADMPTIMEVAKKYNLLVLEDSAVSLGSRMDGKSAGLFGDIGLYSFFQAKPLGSIGDGAVIITNNDQYANVCRMLRNHGQDGVNRFMHHLLGYNCRMDDIQAEYLVHRFKTFKTMLKRREDIASYYNKVLEVVYPKVIIPPKTSYDRVYYTYVIQVERRDELKEYLADKGVETQVYYPLPLPLHPAFEYLGYKRGDFPNAEKVCERSLALPLFPEMADEQVEYVAKTVVSFYE